MPRKDIFITSKLWNTHHPNVKEGLQKTLDSLGTDYLDLYVSAISFDMRHGIWSDEVFRQLIHWPVRLVPVSSLHLWLPPQSPARLTSAMQNETSELLPVNPDGTRSVDRSWDQNETWRQMEEVYKAGMVKAVGLANWSIPYLEELRKTWTVVPAVNQVELHPFLPQHELREYCDKLGILLEAYSPLGSTGKYDSSSFYCCVPQRPCAN